MSENISLKDLLDTTFTINDKGEMVGEFTIKRINMIGDILTNYYKENERLNNIINELEKYIGNKMSSFGVCNASDIYYKLQKLKHKKIYGSVESEIVSFDEVGSDKG